MVARHRYVIAGGLGSGKSSVGKVLSDLGWNVLDTDQAGHAVLSDERIVTQVAELWPNVVKDQSVDRPALASIVFEHPVELATLEAIVHPAVASEVRLWLEGAGARAAVEVSVVKVVRPEWGNLVVVIAPLELRVERAAMRGMDRDDARRRIMFQPSETELLSHADLVIDNSGSEELLATAVKKLDRWTRP